MALTVGELNAILKVENRQFEEALKQAKKSLEKAAFEADEFGEETDSAFKKSTKSADKFGREVKDITKDVSKAKTPMEKLGKNIGTAFKVGVVIAFGKQIADVTMQMANLALEAQESAAAFEITFGSAAKETTRFVNEMAHAFGMTRAEMQQQMAVTGSIIQGMGFTSQAAAGMSENILNLSGDLAAFMNIQEGAVLPAQAITKALTGEREMLKSMGIVLRQVEIDQKAMNMTGKAAVSQLNDQERAAASLTLIEEKMGHIKGQLAREAQGAANQMRQLKAEFKEAQTEVGQALLPAFATFIPVVRELIPTFKEVMATVAAVVQIFMNSLMPALRPLKEIMTALMPIVEAVAELFGNSLSLTLKAVAAILDATLIPMLNGLAKAAEVVMNAFGILTSQQEEYLRSAETAEGVIFRLNEALEAGADPMEAFNAAMAEGNELGIDAADILEDATQASFGFSEKRRDQIKEELKLKQATLEQLQAQKQSGYQTHLYTQGIADLEEEIRMLNGELTSNILKQAHHERSSAAAADGIDDFTESTEESTDAVEENTIKLDKNTQAKLNNVSIQNESIAAMLNLVGAIQKVTEIQGREAVEQEKLNKLLAQRIELEKILAEEKGKGEVQTEVELAQIEKLRKQEQALLTQQQQGLDLKLEIAGAELDLEDAIVSRDEKGEEADARDELSIKQARTRLAQLKEQQANSKDVTIELANVQQNLQDSIANSTMATQKFINAQAGLERLNLRISDQVAKRNEAAIDTEAERLELTEAKLALEAATITAQDRGIMSEARRTLGRVMGLDTAGVNALFQSLGLDLGSFGRVSSSKPFRQMLPPEDRGFLPPSDPPPDPPQDEKKPDTESSIPNPDTSFKKFIEDAKTGGGGFNGVTFSSQIGSNVMDDSIFDLGNPNSAASRFLQARDTNIIINVDPAVDAEIKTQKAMDDFNSKLQVNNRFRVL